MFANLIHAARAKPIEHECARRGFKLKRVSSVERVGPCPICGGVDRFSINLRKGICNCRQCALKGNVIAFVMAVDGVGFHAAVELLTGEKIDTVARCRQPNPVELAKQSADAEEAERRHRAERLSLALRLWKRRQPVAGTVAETYLKHRGYHGPSLATLGFLPANGEYPPTMIAAFGVADEPEPGVVAISDDNITGVHLTRLLTDGSDRERGDDAKIMVGRSMGSPIVLAPVNDLLGMAVVEGIESGLSVLSSTGLGVSVAGAANRMPALAAHVPSYVEAVTIFQEADPAGELYASRLAHSLAGRGIEVRIAEASK